MPPSSPRRRARRHGAASLALAGLASLLAGTTVRGSTPPPPSSLRALLELAGPEPVPADVSFRELELLLASGLPTSGDVLADGVTPPETAPATFDALRQVGCGSSVLAAAARLATQPGHGGLALLASGPRLSAPRLIAVAGTAFIVRYDVSATSQHALSSRDADRSGVPDEVDDVMDALRESSDALAGLVGWTPSASAIDVVVGATPFAEGASLGGARPRLLVPSGLRGAALLEAVAHQCAHLAVQEIAPGLPESFEEALAAYLGEAILADSASLDVSLEQLLPRRHAARSLLSDGPQAARGDANFLRYLGAQLDPSPWLAQVLASFPRDLEDARRRLDARIAPAAAVAESLDRSLASQGWSLAEAVTLYQKWTLEQDLLAHGTSASVDAEIGPLPAEEERRPESLPAFGQLRFGVELPEDGGLRLAFDGDARLVATALALLDDGTVREFAVGRPSRPTFLATGRLMRVVLLVSAPQAPAAWSPSAPALGDFRSERPFAVSAGAEPGYPFTLSNLGAETAPGQVTLSWDTRDERDVVAWHVERALRPSGPYARVTSAPMPPLSWPGELAAYAFVDRTARPSTRYHYRVQAVTSSGLVETSAMTTVRTLPAPQRAPISR